MRTGWQNDFSHFLGRLSQGTEMKTTIFISWTAGPFIGSTKITSRHLISQLVGTITRNVQIRVSVCGQSTRHVYSLICSSPFSGSCSCDSSHSGCCMRVYLGLFFYKAPEKGTRDSIHDVEGLSRRYNVLGDEEHE